jgi:uncharacterized protein YqjF (DUF2071 family)
MKIKHILAHYDHRPWELPGEGWRYYQEWRRPVFLHYPVEAEALRPLVPTDLEIDTIDQQAWVSLVAFSMEQIRPRELPAFPPVSNFLELNVRTYVKYKGKQGVYFLSIEGGKWLSCFMANKLSGLPYRYSKMQYSKDTFTSSNSEFQDKLSFHFKKGAAIKEKSALDSWLTERYALFQDSPGHIDTFELHHLPWELYNVEIANLDASYPRFNHLLGQQPKLCHYSPGVEVVSWERLRERVISI